MKHTQRPSRRSILVVSLAVALALAGATGPACAGVVRHIKLAAGDGFVKMADGRVLYTFGFSDQTSQPTEQDVLNNGMLAAEFPGPTIAVDQGDELYLHLTNVGMVMRPDLFDPHTVHWHGFPNASNVFDGEPMGTVAINMGATFTYYYLVPEPGTYMYHCHAEATEHMQMGMLANLYVRPLQNQLPDSTDLNGFTHHTGYKYVYNDGDGSTRYDVEFPLQLSAFDSDFHDASINIQYLPFAEMHDNYYMINGRGYPDTINPGLLPELPFDENGGRQSQPMNSIISATAGQKVLLRISNLGLVEPFTVGVLGIPMKVVGFCAKFLRGPNGEDLAYLTNSVTLGGGETIDVILDTAGIPPGTYFFYTTNLNRLVNNEEDFGGMMTEIVIN